MEDIRFQSVSTFYTSFSSADDDYRHVREEMVNFFKDSSKINIFMIHAVQRDSNVIDIDFSDDISPSTFIKSLTSLSINDFIEILRNNMESHAFINELDLLLLTHNH